MNEIKELLKTATQNKKSIEESIKGSFHKLATDKNANFIIVQSDKDKNIITIFNNADGTQNDSENKKQYLKAFLPGIDMILLMQDISPEDEKEFFLMVESVLKGSFEGKNFHTISYAKHRKEFLSTAGETWQPLNITDFIDIENFLDKLNLFV